MNGAPDELKSKAITQGVACPKCEHVNPAEKHTCRLCGSHLHISCKKCGARNPRVRSTCTECGQRLHRSIWKKFDRRFKNLTKGKVKVLHIALLVGAVLLAYKVIVMLAEYRPPNPE